MSKLCRIPKPLAAVVLLAAVRGGRRRYLGSDMDALAENYKTICRYEARHHPQTEPAEHARRLSGCQARSTPPKLESKAADSPEMKDFRSGLDTLIGQIDQALARDQGKVAEAKPSAQGFKQTRDANHKKFHNPSSRRARLPSDRRRAPANADETPG